MKKNKRNISDEWSPEFLAALGSWTEEIERPGAAFIAGRNGQAMADTTSRATRPGSKRAAKQRKKK
jgi:hypothetical protein